MTNQPSSEEKKLKTSRLTGDHSLPPAEARSPDPTGPLSTPWRLLVQIMNEGQTTVGLEIIDEIVIGRTDPVAKFKPELDLTPYGGHSGGVSRRHAIIRQQDHALFLQDLNSVNGTRLNGGQLKPGQLYRLRHGDEIEVGKIKLLIRFIQTPS
ncbi:MAG: FHA domain-containing protein [Anaerolineae bacterium]|nr:FHA domain-containing protein [Anaerolineae bacterium]